MFVLLLILITAILIVVQVGHGGTSDNAKRGIYYSAALGFLALLNFVVN